MANLTLNYKIHTSTKYPYFSLQNGTFKVGFTQPIKILLTITFSILKIHPVDLKKFFYIIKIIIVNTFFDRNDKLIIK